MVHILMLAHFMDFVHTPPQGEILGIHTVGERIVTPTSIMLTPIADIPLSNWPIRKLHSKHVPRHGRRDRQVLQTIFDL